MVPKDKNLTQRIICCASLLLFRKECYHHFIYTSVYKMRELKRGAAGGEPTGNASAALQNGEGGAADRKIIL